MKGSMLLTAEGHSHIQIQQGIDIEHEAEKVLLLHAFCDALEIGFVDVIAYLSLQEELNNTTETVRIDASAIKNMFGKKGDDSE